MPIARMHPVVGPITGAYLATAPDPPWRPSRPHHGVDYGVSKAPCKHYTVPGRIIGVYGPGKPLGDGSFGRCVVVDIEGTPWFILYAHLSRIDVKVGDWVETGQVLGITGGSGMKAGVFSETAYGDHLHIQKSKSQWFPRDHDTGGARDLTGDPLEGLNPVPTPETWEPMDEAKRREFWTALLARFDTEATSWRIAFLEEWARWEGTGARWNPLATTRVGGEYAPDPYWNTFGPNGEYHVRNYKDFERGVEATAETLALSYYVEVRAALSAQTIESPADVAANLETWGTKGFAAQVRNGWQPVAAPDGYILEDVATSLNNLNDVVHVLRGRIEDLEATVAGVAIGETPPHTHSLEIVGVETGGVTQ